MKLPYCESAVVRPDKVTDYLLSTAHPNGRHKAKFFMGFGFSAAVWQQLENALVKHAEEHKVALHSHSTKPAKNAGKSLVNKR